MIEKAGDALDIIGHRVKGDLKNVTSFIQPCGHEGGSRRGEVDRAPRAGETVT